MADLDRLRAQARKARRLAGGLSNRNDVRVLEELAGELEASARALEAAARQEARAA